MIETIRNNRIRLEEMVRSLTAERDALADDATRLDWLTFHISGKALRDIGVVWSEHRDARNAIDAAMRERVAVS